MENWNKADKLLAVVTALFIIALLLKLQYPENLYIKGFLFCTEAALVGGVADLGTLGDFPEHCVVDQPARGAA